MSGRQRVNDWLAGRQPIPPYVARSVRAHVALQWALGHVRLPAGIDPEGFAGDYNAARALVVPQAPHTERSESGNPPPPEAGDPTPA